MSWELARFMVQQVGVALLRMNEGVMYKVRSPYRFPGDEYLQLECAEILCCREGEIFPAAPSETIEAPPYLCDWSIHTEIVFQSQGRPGGLLPMRRAGALGGRIFVWCPDPVVFRCFFDVATDAGLHVELLPGHGDGWYYFS